MHLVNIMSVVCLWRFKSFSPHQKYILEIRTLCNHGQDSKLFCNSTTLASNWLFLLLTPTTIAIETPIRRKLSDLLSLLVIFCVSQLSRILNVSSIRQTMKMVIFTVVRLMCRSYLQDVFPVWALARNPTVPLVPQACSFGNHRFHCVSSFSSIWNLVQTLIAR